MNKFEFIGTIVRPKDTKSWVKTNSKGYRTLKMIVKQNDNNSAFIQVGAEPNYKNELYVKSNVENKVVSIPYEKRFDMEILKNTSYVSKIVTNVGCANGSHAEFISKNDFINWIVEKLPDYSPDTVFKIKGEYIISEYKGRLYNNFNIKSFMIAEGERPELKLSLDLYYDYRGLDESDKRNKFILNAYLSQYNYTYKMYKYYPIQVQFITNRFDFKNAAHVEIIVHRKANIHPTQEEGYVKATWEAQYVHGAQLIMPPLETLPKDIQFEIKNAGRDIKEYMCNVVGEAEEYICLTRPNNTLDKEGKVYHSLKCSNQEFENLIIKLENESPEEKTIDNIAKQEAQENPFN